MSESLRIALSIFVYGFLGFVYLIVTVAVISEVKRWLRARRAESVEPSPLIREINRWREAHDRAFRRAGIVQLEGHPRVGIDHVKRGAAVREHPAP